MWFVGLGLLQILLHFAGVGYATDWSWNFTGDLWKFLFPFGCAMLWWAWADYSGYNKRREMEALDQRKAQRRIDNLAHLGLDPAGRRQFRRR